MIPVKLIIEGLYSYQERQIIDFSKLTEAGLFGIFGAVGSGKSSILESISYALYGEIERLNSREKRAYNMMNLKSKRLYIEFDFINHENKLFKATREFKRNSKRFDDIKSPVSVFYEFKEGEWIPLDHVNAEQILGLSYNNFKRTIIIPQGQFKEFLELKAKERTDMMKEIFDLDRFDLQFKVASLHKENQTKLDQLIGKLSGFENITSENINAKRLEVEENEILLNSIQKQHDELDNEFQKLIKIKSDFEILNQKKKEFETLETQKERCDTKKKEVEEFEKIHSLFYIPLLEQKKLIDEIKNNNIECDIQKKEYKKTFNQLENLKSEIEKIKEDFELLPTKRIQETDKENLIQILQSKKVKKVLNDRLIIGEKYLEDLIEKKEFLNKVIKEADEKIEEINKNKLSSDEIIKVGNWFSTLNHINQNIESKSIEIRNLNERLESLQSSLGAFSISISNFEEDFNNQIEDVNKQKRKIESHRNYLNVQKQLAHFSDALHDGESCPLCGSLDHPNIAEISDVSDQLNDADLAIKKLENAKEEIEKKRSEVRRINEEILFFKKQITEQNENLLKLENDLKNHQLKFTWKEFNPNNPKDFEIKKEKNADLEREIVSKNEFIKKSRQALEKEDHLFQIGNKRLEELKIQKAEINNSIQQNLSRLAILNFSDYEDYDADVLKEEWVQLKTLNDSLEEKYKLLEKNFNELNPKLASQKVKFEISENLLKKQQDELIALHSNIQTILENHNFSSLEWVEEILNKRLNISAIRKEIEEFTIQYKTAQNSIIELNDKLKDVSFNEENYELKKVELNELKIKLKEAVENVTKLKANLEHFEKEFQTKKDLLTAKEKLDSRAENLKTLTNLFKSSGFVQYVSSIYLRQLCDVANERFHRLTRNQLSLHLNENNDFEVIDYLNEGRNRSVKTLSGGQSFQVSLSLALALAESVQSNFQGEKNFFFIDEGFGTQDAESVNVVFETLMNLQKENRIVGVISHVEELKEKIPIALNIVKDAEKGSLIEWVNN